MRTTIGERVKELRQLAEKRGVADEVGDIYDPNIAIQAYAEALNLDAALVFDLDSTLAEIVQFSKLLS